MLSIAQGIRTDDQARFISEELGYTYRYGEARQLRGVASQLLSEHFQSADVRLHLGRTRTYPGVLPLLHLDHIYYDAALQLEAATLHRSRTALLASDHLPLSADFYLRPPA